MLSLDGPFGLRPRRLIAVAFPVTAIGTAAQEEPILPDDYVWDSAGWKLNAMGELSGMADQRH